MIDMVSKVKETFPELYTKRGELSKREPKKYQCSCGHPFFKLKTTLRLPGITFASPICEQCGKKAKENIAYNIWKRMENHQLEQEDFILNTVAERTVIEKKELESLLAEQFQETTQALGTLVYFGYLIVDAQKRDEEGVVEYRINSLKDLENRYEHIR